MANQSKMAAPGSTMPKSQVGNNQFPRFSNVSQNRSSARLYTCSKDEMVVSTKFGWVIVDREMWQMPVRKREKMEPPLASAYLDMAMSMMPLTWPKWFRERGEDAIRALDPRKSSANQRTYRVGVSDMLSAKPRSLEPNIMSIVAIWCLSKGKVKWLVDKLRGHGWEWMADPLNFEFNEELAAVRPRGTSGPWRAVGHHAQPASVRETLREYEETRQRPVYIEQGGEEYILVQPELTPLRIPAHHADVRACTDALMISQEGKIIFPKIVRDDQNCIVSPPDMIHHLFINSRKANELVPDDHPGLSGRPIVQPTVRTGGGANVSSNRDIRAEQRLLEALPDGYEIIPTSGDGLMCGVRAIQLSMTEQHADVGVPLSRALYNMLGKSTTQTGVLPSPTQFVSSLAMSWQTDVRS